MIACDILVSAEVERRQVIGRTHFGELAVLLCHLCHGEKLPVCVPGVGLRGMHRLHRGRMCSSIRQSRSLFGVLNVLE